MRKLVLFAALTAILFAFGCNEEKIYMPDVNTDGRVIGTIQGVVFDGADQTLLPGVEVSTTIRGAHVTTITDATGHYSFTNLDPGDYVLTFIFPSLEDKVVKSAYAGVTGETYIPTLDELRENYYNDYESPTDEDFRHEVEADVALYPLNGGAEGYVFMQMDAQTQTPAEGCTVVADFGGDYNPYSGGGTKIDVDAWEVNLIDNEWFATVNEDGWYTFSGLPTGVDGILRTLPFNYSGMAFGPEHVDLELHGGGIWLADDLVLGSYDQPHLIAMNWDANVPFPAGGTFRGTFNIPMDPATFVAELDDYDKTLLPVTVTWEGNTVIVDPVNDMVPGYTYTLRLAGWSVDGQDYNEEYWYIHVVDAVPPSIIATNFEDIPFPVDGNLVFTFNMAMDPTTFTIWFDEDKLGDIVFNSSWNVGATVLTIDPVVDLDLGYYYQIRLQGKSVGGQLLATTNWYYFNTFQYQDVVVVATNLPEDGLDFPATANPYVTFSEPMDPTMDIMLYEGCCQVLDFDVAWSAGNATVTVTPELPFEQGVQYRLIFDGTTATGGADFYWSKYFTTFIGDDAFIVTTNTEEDDFPVDGNIQVQFNKPIDRTSVEIAFSGLSVPLYGVVTWTNDENLVFNPDALLYPATTYSFSITGTAQDGGDLDDSFTFMTAGGIEAVWNNIRQVDGTYEGFPVSGAIQFRFNMPVNLDVDETLVTLYRTSLLGTGPITPVEVLQTFAVSDGGLLLTITPDQVLQAETDYRISYRVYSFLMNDFWTETINFKTELIPTEPVAVVTDFVLDPDWDGNYDETNVYFEWTRDPNADGYYVYARFADAAKEDYLRVATVAQPVDFRVTTISTTADLTGGLTDPAFTEIFDTRYWDTPQTPFDGGQEVLFLITAYNDLGEGPVSDVISVGDVFGPGGAFTGQTSDLLDSADDTAQADGEDLVVMVEFHADEYLDITTMPVVEITENDLSVNTWGDPLYTPTIGEVTMEDDDAGYTVIMVEVIVADGMNGAGDYVSISGFLDSSGNEIDAATVIAPWQLIDRTPPSGLWTDQDVSADNSMGATPVDITLTFVATELLNEAVPPVISLVNAGIPNQPVYSNVYAYSVVGGVSVLEVTAVIPAGFNVRDDIIRITGLRDLVGNLMTEVIEWTLEDRTPPNGFWTFQSVSAQNYSGAAVPMTVTFTAYELLDHAAVPAPVLIITDGGFIGELAVDADNMVMTDVGVRTTVSFDLTIPAGMNAWDDLVGINGMTDVSGNLQTVATESALEDSSEPAAPVGLGGTPSNDYLPSVTLNWTDNTEPDVATYTVGRSLVSGSGYVEIASGLATSDYIDNDVTLVLGTTYYYVVTATDEAGNESNASSEASATPVDTTAPPQPVGLVAVAGVNSPASVRLTWTVTPAPVVASYNVFVGLNLAGPWLPYATGVTSPFNAINPPVALGTQVFFYITAVDAAANESIASTVVNGTPTDVTPPATPAGLAAADGAGAGIIDITWTPWVAGVAPNGDTVGYGVYYDTASPASGGTLVPVPGIASSGVSIPGLVTGTTYYFTIIAQDGVALTSPEAAEITWVAP